jgi:hypothetical protein
MKILVPIVLLNLALGSACIGSDDSLLLTPTDVVVAIETWVLPVSDSATNVAISRALTCAEELWGSLLYRGQSYKIVQAFESPVLPDLLCVWVEPSEYREADDPHWKVACVAQYDATTCLNLGREIEGLLQPFRSIGWASDVRRRRLFQAAIAAVVLDWDQPFLQLCVVDNVFQVGDAFEGLKKLQNESTHLEILPDGSRRCVRGDTVETNRIMRGLGMNFGVWYAGRGTRVEPDERVTDMIVHSPTLRATDDGFTVVFCAVTDGDRAPGRRFALSEFSVEVGGTQPARVGRKILNLWPNLSAAIAWCEVNVKDR